MRARARASRLHGRSTRIVTSSLQLHRLHANPTIRKCSRVFSAPFRRVLRPQTLPRSHVTISWTNRKRSTTKKNTRKIKKKWSSKITIHTHYETALLSPGLAFQRLCCLPFACQKIFSHWHSRISIQYRLFFLSSGNSLNRKLLALASTAHCWWDKGARYCFFITEYFPDKIFSIFFFFKSSIIPWAKLKKWIFKAEF